LFSIGTLAMASYFQTNERRQSAAQPPDDSSAAP
jgi:hypothetical protein